MLLAATARTFGQRPSSLLGITEPRVALDLDEALHLVLVRAERADRAVAAGSPFGRLDAVLAGRSPRRTPDGLRYEDPTSLYREAMAARRAEGLVN